MATLLLAYRKIKSDLIDSGRPPLDVLPTPQHWANFAVQLFSQDTASIWADRKFCYTLEYLAWLTGQLFIVLFIFDVVLLKWILRKTNPVHRWFYLHFVGNMVTCYYALPNIITLMQDPIQALVVTRNQTLDTFYWEATWTVACTHTWHLLFYKCTADELFHHIAFVAGGVSTGFLADFGRLADFYQFFVSGLPGGVDYLLLGLVKDGVLTKQQRLKAALEINVWMRSPGVLASWWMAVMWFIGLNREHKDAARIYSLLAVSFASYFNAQFYLKQVALAAGSSFHAKPEAPPSSPVAASPTAVKEKNDERKKFS